MKNITVYTTSPLASSNVEQLGMCSWGSNLWTGKNTGMLIELGEAHKKATSLSATRTLPGPAVAAPATNVWWQSADASVVYYRSTTATAGIWSLSRSYVKTASAVAVLNDSTTGSPPNTVYYSAFPVGSDGTKAVFGRITIADSLFGPSVYLSNFYDAAGNSIYSPGALSSDVYFVSTRMFLPTSTGSLYCCGGKVYKWGGSSWSAVSTTGLPNAVIIYGEPYSQGIIVTSAVGGGSPSGAVCYWNGSSWSTLGSVSGTFVRGRLKAVGTTIYVGHDAGAGGTPYSLWKVSGGSLVAVQDSASKYVSGAVGGMGVSGSCVYLVGQGAQLSDGTTSAYVWKYDTSVNRYYPVYTWG